MFPDASCDIITTGYEMRYIVWHWLANVTAACIRKENWNDRYFGILSLIVLVYMKSTSRLGSTSQRGSMLILLPNRYAWRRYCRLHASGGYLAGGLL